MALSNSSCVVLVPVGGSIVPECDDALKELEHRGYVVRRVRGYSQVDVARNQLATEALRDGFEELFWIDSDIVFHPDDVDRLRRHQQPFVCAIYPKKGPREFACNYLPGTETLQFGEGGGLTELQYVGFGFNLTHRSVYESVRRQCDLPICNERFQETLIPFFMPMVVNDEYGAWYLGEDYAFCERVRQCGFRVLVDTTIRLWHVGTYKYSWEEAGRQPERYSRYHYATGVDWRQTQASQLKGTAEHGASPAWARLQAEYPWPAERPDVIPHLRHGWLNDSVRQLLARELTRDVRLVLELGGWLGLSTRYILAQAPQAAVITVDHWQGSPEHVQDPQTARLLPRLYDTFLANCWPYRHRLLPLRMDTVTGIQAVAKTGLRPDKIYLDADHSYEAVMDDLRAIRSHFPEATVIGDDWDWDEVRQAATEFALHNGLLLEAHGLAWKLSRLI